MKVYSVTSEDVTTYFGKLKNARAFERAHIDTGCECDAPITHTFRDSHALADFLNGLTQPVDPQSEGSGSK